MKSNVRIENGTTVINAEKVLFNSDSKTAKVDGGVRIAQDNIVITADKMDADFKNDKVRVSGNVKLELTETLTEKDESASQEGRSGPRDLQHGDRHKH